MTQTTAQSLVSNQSEYWVKSFDGTYIWYRRLGSGRLGTFILCDGVGCAGYIWRKLIPLLEKDFRIIHWNYRGHGRTDVPDDLDSISIENFAKDLDAITRHARLKKPFYLVGHSMGVQVIFEYYHQFPKKVAALVAMTGTYGHMLDHVFDTKLLKMVFPLFERLTRIPGIFPFIWQKTLALRISKWVARYGVINPTLTHPEDMEPYFQDLAAMNPKVFAITLKAGSQHTAESWLKHIKIPTMVFGGNRDNFTPDWLSHHMKDMIPNSQFTALPGGSHIGPLEFPEFIQLRLEKFVKELD